MFKHTLARLISFLGLLLAFPVVADEAQIQAWTAPPYWAPPAATEMAAGHGRRAEGRQSLVGSPAALPFISLFPCRLVDTRGNAPLTGGFLPAATVRSYTLRSICNVPPEAQAISLNVTVVHPTGPGFLTIYPEGGAFPPVSTLNYLGGDVIVNAAVVPLSATGGVSIALGVSGGDVILDTNGYYAVSDVASLSGLVGDVTLAAGTNVTITPAGNTLTIASTGGSGGPPTGAAGGSLAGTYPNPTLAASSVGTSQIASGAVTDVKVASGIAYAKLSGVPTSLPPSGSAAGGLAGTYPNPTIGANAVGTTQVADGAVTDAKVASGIAYGKLSGAPASLPPSGAAAGDLGGTYPSPTVAKVGTSTASNIHSAELIANAATNGNTPNAIVRRDAAGGFAAGTITASLTGAASANVLKTGDTMTGNLILSPGNISLDSSTGATGNVFKGGERFLHAVGPGNTFLGIDAGSLLAAGNKNTGIGAFALTTVSSGSNNTALGWSALAANTTSADNTAVGREALKSNTSGFQNTAVGSSALSSNTTGLNNTATGFNALLSNATGGENTAIGVAALVANVSGSFNTAMGESALPGNTSGDANTAIGRSTMWSNTTGAFNVSIGAGSMQANATGSDITAVGAQSLPLSTSGPNTAVGFKSLFNATTGTNNTVVGYLAGARDYPFPKYIDGTPFNSVPITTGNYNTFVGHAAGSVLNVSNCTAIGIDAYCDGDNQVRLGNAFVGSIGGKVGWSALSDARAKNDIRDLDRGLDFVLRLRPVAYTLKAGSGRTDMGFLAQDVEALLGEGYGVLGVGGDPDRTLSLRYQDFIAPLVKAVQEQQAIIEKDRNEIRELEARLERLEALIASSTR